MDRQQDFNTRLERIGKSVRRPVSRAETNDPVLAKGFGAKKRAKLQSKTEVKSKPYWRVLGFKILLISIFALFSFRVLAHVQGVDMVKHRDTLAAGDANDKVAAAIIGFSMIPDSLYLKKPEE